MLSICIPVYNNEIVTLVNYLFKQCIDCKIPFEIICIDDASTLFKEKNKSISTHSEIKYSELTQNIGRAAIRNLLAEQAIYPYILYLDSDISVRSNNFIKKYIECIEKSIPVVVGGIDYVSHNKKETSLHLQYGLKRESVELSKRVKNPYSSFLTGNLLIQKKLVHEIQFLSTLKEYGHEDTLFCMELKKRSIPIVHICNPIVHEGLEQNKIFIQKQLTAVKNLSSLILKGDDMTNVYIYSFYQTLKKHFLLGPFLMCFFPVKSLVKKALESGWTKWLLLFDALRLYELSVCLKKNQNN